MAWIIDERLQAMMMWMRDALWTLLGHMRLWAVVTIYDGYGYCRVARVHHRDNMGSYGVKYRGQWWILLPGGGMTAEDGHKYNRDPRWDIDVRPKFRVRPQDFHKWARGS